jgi:hypothetical protein
MEYFQILVYITPPPPLFNLFIIETIRSGQEFEVYSTEPMGVSLSLLNPKFLATALQGGRYRLKETGIAGLLGELLRPGLLNHWSHNFWTIPKN